MAASSQASTGGDDASSLDMKKEAEAFHMVCSQQKRTPQQVTEDLFKVMVSRGYAMGLHLRETTRVKVLSVRTLGTEAREIVFGKRWGASLTASVFASLCPRHLSHCDAMRR